jgi:putative membrane protein
MYWRHNGGMGLGPGGWVLMAVGMALFWAVVVVLLFALVRYANRAPHHHDHVHTPFASQPSAQSAEQVLAERFARGDIDEDEYRRRLRTLREAGS